MSNANFQAAINRLVAGLLPRHEFAVRRALGRIGGLMLGDDAVLHPSIFGYDVTASSGASVQAELSVPGIFICTDWSLRGHVTDAVNDNLNKLRVAITRQHGAPYIGDTRQGVSVLALGELNTPWALSIPWIILPTDGTMFRVTAETLTDTCRVTLALSGFCLYGASAGGAR